MDKLIPTSIKVRKTDKAGQYIKAFVDVTFNELLTVKDLKVIQSKDGSYYVAMPSERDKNDKTKYHARVFINDSSKENTPGRAYSDKLQAAILQAFQSETDTSGFDQTQSQGGSSLVTDNVPF